MTAAATGASKEVSTKRVTPVKQGPTLGKNATFYFENELPKRVGGKRKAKDVVRIATELAKSRSDKTVRVEYLFVAEGRATERDFGTPKMHKMRQEVVNKRVPRRSRVKVVVVPEARPRQQRQKANAAAVAKGAAEAAEAGKTVGRAQAKKDAEALASA